MAGSVQVFLFCLAVYWTTNVKGISVPTTSYTTSIVLPFSDEGYSKPTEKLTPTIDIERKVEVENYDLSRLPPEVRELYFRLIQKMTPNGNYKPRHTTGKRDAEEGHDDLSRLPVEVGEKMYAVAEPMSGELDSSDTSVFYVPVPRLAVPPPPLPVPVIPPPPPLPILPPPPPPPPHAEKSFKAEWSSEFKLGSGMLMDIRKLLPIFNLFEKEKKPLPIFDKGFLKQLGIELEGHSEKKVEMNEVKPVIEKPHLGEILLKALTKLVDGAHIALEKFKKP